MVKLNFNKIQNALKSILMEFNSLSTDKAELYWNEDTELQVGYEVFIENEGEKIAAPDDEYISDENKIKVEGGKVIEIERKEEIDAQPIMEEPIAMEEEKVEEIDAQPIMEEPIMEDPIKPLMEKIAELEAKIAELEAKIMEIAQAPAAVPIAEEFEAATKEEKSGNKMVDKYTKMFSSK